MEDNEVRGEEDSTSNQAHVNYSSTSDLSSCLKPILDFFKMFIVS